MLIPDNIRPEDSIYYNGAKVLEIILLERRITIAELYVRLREKLNIDNEFIKGWKDALISGNEVYYVGVQNDEPYMERVNPLFFSYDKSPDLEFIEDGSWCCRKMRLPVAEVYDRYYNKLDEKDLNKLNEMLTGKPMGDMREGDPVDTGGGIQMHIYDNPEFD